MPSLHDLQRRFVAALLHGEDAHIAPHIIEGGFDAAQRIAIYRNNLLAGHAKALELEFPVIARLVGPDYFRQLSAALLRESPSRSGDLHHVGAPFPQFLAARFAGTAYQYLGDVAALEWARQEVAIAPDATPLSLATLATVVAPGCQSAWRLALHPAVRLVESVFPIVAIWRANAVATLPATIDLRAGGDHVLVHRVSGGVAMRSLPPRDYRFAVAIAAGHPLEVAVQLASTANFPDEDPDLPVTPAPTSFDLARALHTLLTCEALLLLEDS